MAERTASAEASFAEPDAQLRLVGWWLVGVLGSLFTATALLDVTLILVLPILALASAIVALGFSVRGARLGRRLRGDRRASIVAGSAMPVAGLLSALLALPVGRLGGLTQAYGVLLLNQDRYERVIAAQVEPEMLEGAYARSGGSGAARIWTFSYGGFLSIDRDIVYDPLDRPELRAVRLLDATAASCNWLRSHYYDCTLDS